MRKLYTLLFIVMFAVNGFAQTLNVNVGEVTYAYKAADTGDMIYSGGSTLTILGKVFNISDINSITVDNTEVADNTVSVAYSGTTAKVVVAGNLASSVTVSATAADVNIVAGASVANEITYTLSGTSSDGSFFMDGEYKAIVVLKGLNLTNANGGAIDIENGKRIAVVLADGTTNTLVDGTGTQSACFFINGHAEFEGAGTLNITGNVKHAYSSDEYTLIKQSTGNIVVKSAVSDGFHVNQYFQMNGGTVSITATGDGIDVGADKDTSVENNGQIILNGGTLSVISTGDASKGISAEGNITEAGTAVTVLTSGKAYYDDTEKDITSSSAVKTDAQFVMSGGTMNLKSTGIGGKGINATGDVNVSGGTLTVVTTGALYQYDANLDTKPQGIKTDGDINLMGGNTYAAVMSVKATTLKTDNDVSLTGGTLMCIGGKSFAFAAGSQTSKVYTGVNVTSGSTVVYNGVTFVVPSDYSYSGAIIRVSSPSM